MTSALAPTSNFFELATHFEPRYSSPIRRYHLDTPAKSSQDSIYGCLRPEQIPNEYSVENIVETPTPRPNRFDFQVESLISDQFTDFH